MSEQAQSISERLLQASQSASRQSGSKPVSGGRIEDALAGAIAPRKLIDNFAEAWRVSESEALKLLDAHGFGGILSRLAPTAAAAGEEATRGPLGNKETVGIAGGNIRVRTLGPALNEALTAPASVLESVERAIGAFLPGADKDSLGVLYRDRPIEYARKFLAGDAPKIDAYVSKHFGSAGPKYIINSGIGANEQFNYFVSALANAHPGRRTTWLLANSPKEIAALPADAGVESALFLEFSRSGITEETVKLHELTPRNAKRVVFANSGPLKALAERDQNLLLELPSEVSGRYGRNKTPILMAPMHVAGMDVQAYWQVIQDACDQLRLSDAHSLPVMLAQYIRIQQLRRGVNHIYLGTNDELLRYSADEFCQFWNEGVNRDGNDITMSRYLGLPRDSHMNLEAILGTNEHKLAVFIVATRKCGAKLTHSLLQKSVDAISPAHAGLSAEDVDLILTLANVKRCSEKMPTILVAVDEINLEASAWLGQLWADTTLVYSRLIGADPGSNPEVKSVRTRASAWLADRKGAEALLAPSA